MSQNRSTVEQAQADLPYCRNCGYQLQGLTDSSRCPECGRPIVEVLVRTPRTHERGRRYRSAAKLFGLPIIDIAIGPKNGEMRGKARGVIAIGDDAMGFIAIGGLARGIVAAGGLAVGACSVGGGAVGLIGAVGGGAAGGMATGGGAAGLLAAGGAAVGLLAQGGAAFGLFTRSALGVRPASAAAVFDRFFWFFGAWPPNPLTLLYPLTACAGAIFLLAAAIGLLAWRGMKRSSQGASGS